MFKSVSLALAAIAASATIASADASYLSTFAPSNDRSTEIELGLIVAEDASVVEIFAYNNGQTGKLLGSEPIRAGGNPDVDVEISPVFGDAIAVLRIPSTISAPFT